MKRGILLLFLVCVVFASGCTAERQIESNPCVDTIDAILEIKRVNAAAGITYDVVESNSFNSKEDALAYAETWSSAMSTYEIFQQYQYTAEIAELDLDTYYSDTSNRTCYIVVVKKAGQPPSNTFTRTYPMVCDSEGTLLPKTATHWE